MVFKSNEHDSSLHLFVRSHLGRALGRDKVFFSIFIQEQQR